MHVLIVLAHHEPRSFNAALTNTASKSLQDAGHSVTISDLHAMQWDPISDRRNFTTVADGAYLKQQREEMHATEHNGFSEDVRAEMEKLEKADALILQFPLWWFSVPAIMKGWVDRVFAMGRVYGGGKWYDNGVFAGKRAMCSLTTGGPPSMYAPDGLNGDMDMILFPINHGILRFTGFDVLPPQITWGPSRMTPEARQADLDAMAARVAGMWDETPIEYPSLAEFDEQFRRRPS
ncbi:MAG: NAD(P)H-dependent oxidoreductase [Phycisphaerales bacterium]